MGNCFVSDGVGGDLEGNRPLKTAPTDFEVDHVKEVLKKIKKVRFADHREYFGDPYAGAGEDGGVRIKVVISKKKLLEMIERGGITVGDGFVAESGLLIESRSKARNYDDSLFDSWKPGLESIPKAI
ncbi:hypothetical protein MLD38_026636 [Melastoma candidum]|uniref:Uncharacterized protein n=1 Tax=Melastoma candidum TaxID=119954 RepID=A0ACB9NZ20_9MYRT|nr:hypothetical protein MLD38_026636 [Melastoma candidum]